MLKAKLVTGIYFLPYYKWQKNTTGTEINSNKEHRSALTVQFTHTHTLTEQNWFSKPIQLHCKLH